MELSVIRGFGYALAGFGPADFVTYVKWDFPFPAVSGKDTLCQEQKVKFPLVFLLPTFVFTALQTY